MNAIRRILQHPVGRCAAPFWCISLAGVILQSKPLIAFGMPVMGIVLIYAIAGFIRG